MIKLVEKFQEYSAWRHTLVQGVEEFRDWLREAHWMDSQMERRIANLLARLADDKMSIAFIAEFSRGKSELINAIFFADYGQRILPSSAGRTTMCPTELMYDETLPPSIRLLPIETRAYHATTADYKTLPQEWRVMPLDIASSEGMLEAFRQVSQVKRVPVDDARRYALFDEDDPDQVAGIDAAGTVEISMWRHAVINFPHPLLRQGLVILDTPGLNAIGTEPELTLNLIPSAHAVLFILAADTGVTKSDIEVWRNHIGSRQGRIAVLNKIDSMWDDLKTPAQVEADIQRQCDSCARLLGLDQSQVFPVSAQKGLLAKVQGDDALLERSRLPDLERALSFEMIPRKQSIVRDMVVEETGDLMRLTHAMLTARGDSLAHQAADLHSLRGKNSTVIGHMLTRVRAEKEAFDQSLVKFQALRTVFARLTAQVFAELGLARLREQIRATRSQMEGATFSTGMRDAMDGFFRNAHESMARSQTKADDIADMVGNMYRKFGAEHGMVLGTPMGFSLTRYTNEIRRVEGIYRERFGMRTLLTNEKVALTQKFFETIASRVKETFETANRDLESWLKAIVAPLEGQIHEHQNQLKRRLESIQNIRDASATLEERIAEVKARQSELNAHAARLAELQSAIQWTLDATIDADQGALLI